MTERPASPWIPVGIDGIAEHLGVTQDTVVTWRRRSAKEWVTVAKFPEPAGKISGRDWWWLADILEWARETGRLKDEGEQPLVTGSVTNDLGISDTRPDQADLDT